jgi:phosphatidylserine decarboxylase
MSFAKECWPFVLPVAALALLLAVAGQRTWALAALALAAVLLLFFRIPQRDLDFPEGVVLAPANGKILRIDRVDDPTEIGPGSYHHVVIFLSVFNVHVQRAPVEGRVVTSRYSAGRKLAAFDPRAGEVNERYLTVIRHPSGNLFGVRQIAGLLARRVVTYLETGQSVARGELIGVIKFGSRVDLLLPVSYHLEVQAGQKVHEGATVIARKEKMPL